MQKPSEDNDRTIIRPVQKADPDPAEVDPLVGTDIGGCHIECLIGRGAMGAVYRARQVRLDRTVAVKVMRSDLLADKRAVQRFENEAKTVGRFNSPFVVMIHDVGQVRDLHYLIMEFVPGVNLRQHAQSSGGRIEFGAAIRLMRQACEGLKEAQRLAVLHRDIKPDNLMLGERGDIKIADFGISKALHGDFSLTMTSELLGTPLYMSPEQCRASNELDFRSDMFSLGATFYYLLTGEPPAKANSVYELIETKTHIDCLSLSKVMPEISSDHPLSRIVEKMTALDRDDRYASYDDVIDDLDRVAKGQKPRATRQRSPRPPARPSRRGLWIATASVLLCGGAVTAWALSGGTNGAGASTAVKESGATAVDASASRVAPSPDVGRQQADVRSRLRREGPSPDLQTALAAIVTRSPSEVDEQAALTLALEQATAAQQRLRAAELQRPSPQLPFDDVVAFLGAVDAAAAVDGLRDPDVKAWLDAEAARVRNLDALRTDARAAVIGSWAQWQTDRAKIAPDAANLQALSERLRAIRAGGARLMEIFGADAASLRLPVEDWNEAERALHVPQVDLGERLQQFGTQFRLEGPSTRLRGEAQAIESKDQAVMQKRTDLLAAIDLAERIRTNLDRLRVDLPPVPVPPFDRLEDYYARVDTALREASASTDADLRALAERWRTEARAEDDRSTSAIASLGDTWSACQSAQDAAGADVAQLRKIGDRLASAQRGRECLLRLFPARQAEIEAAMPVAAATATGARIDTAARIGTAAAAIAQTHDVAAKIGTVDRWQQQKARIDADLAAHRAAVTALGELDTEVRPALDALERLCSERSRAAAAVSNAFAQFADGQLDLRAALDPMARIWPEEVATLTTAATAARTAFTELQRRADLEAAARELQAAREALGRQSAAAAATARVENWLRSVDELRSATGDLVPIPGGTARTSAGPSEVDAFFVSPHEVARQQWLAFLVALEQAWAETASLPADQRPAQLAAKFGAIPDARTVETLLRRRRTLLDDSPALAREPIDEVSQYGAAIFAHWQRRSLPTLAEWTLAALGPAATARPFPWGDEWSNDRAVRNIGRALQPVDEGGLTSGVRLPGVRHLVGNAAEWLEADSKAVDGQLAGGSCSDTLIEAKDAAAGKPRRERRSAYEVGFGLRTIVRPRAFFGASWPR